MEPFSIICGTCAAKLKVTRESAIGQVLACPKCSNMVRVTPPPGWKPAEQQSSDDVEDADSSADAFASGAFDDIDAVLATSDAANATGSPTKKPAVPGPPRKSGQPTAEKRPAKKTPAGNDSAASAPASDADSPLLPNEQWTTPEARARKQMILIGGVALAGLVIIGTIVGAIVMNRGNTPDNGSESVAANGALEEDAGSNDEDTSNDPDALNESGNPNENNADDTADADDNPNPETGESDSDADTDQNNSNGTDDPESAATDIATTDIATTDADDAGNPAPPANPLEVAENEADAEQLNESGTQDEDPGPLDPNPLDRNPLGGSDVLNGGILSPETELSGPGELASLLAEANSSILEFQNITDAIRDEESSGMPRYYIEKPDAKIINIDRQLGLNCAGLKYEDQPVIYALREITALLGLAFHIDVDSWQAAGIPFDAQVNVHVENESYAVVIEKILEPHGLESVVRPEGIIVVRAKGSTSMTDHEYELPPVNNPDQQAAREGQLAAVRQLVDPQSWIRELNTATAELAGDRLNVRQSPQGHHEIQLLFDKVRAIQEVMGGGIAADDVEILKSASASAESYISLPLAQRYSYPTPIEALLTRIHRQSDVMILVDWNAVAREGWTPATLIPGQFNEATPISAAKELAASMDLTVRVVDSRTLELTSYDAAASRSDLELFYCGDIINGALTEEHLIDLFNRTIGPQLNSTPGVKVDYDPELKSIIAYAPQPLQRQIEAIIKRLGRIGGTGG